MAGSPRKKARLEAAKAALTDVTGSSEVAEALIEQKTNPFAFKNRAAVTPKGVTGPSLPRKATKTPWVPHLGPLTKNSVDQVTTAAISELSEHLRPGLRARLARVKPPWCSGWLEDMQIIKSDLTDLLNYLSEEYGGQTYNVSVLSSDGRTLFESQLNVAGPPKFRGRLIDRDEWEGVKKAHAVVAQSAPPIATNELLSLFKDMLKERDSYARQQNDLARQVTDAIKAGNQEIFKALIAANAASGKSVDLTGQVNELLKLFEVTDRVSEVIEKRGGSSPEPKSTLEEVSNHAMKTFLDTVIKTKVGSSSAVPPKAPIADALIDGGTNGRGSV